jgi:hypothetical protein
MTRRMLLMFVAAIAPLALAGGCDDGSSANWPIPGGAGPSGLLGPGTPARSRALGAVDKQLAFTTAKDVMGMYFDIESADPDKGTIQARPKMVEERRERLVGRSPTRQVASMLIVSGDGQVSARISIATQQQGSSMFRTMRGETYSGVPDQTPAEMEAATTVQQNETWRTIGYAYETERKMLDDIYRRLHPQE